MLRQCWLLPKSVFNIQAQAAYYFLRIGVLRQSGLGIFLRFSKKNTLCTFLWDIVKYAIRNKECRNAVWIDFICNKQTRANCERAKGKGVFKFRKLKKTIWSFRKFFWKIYQL